MFIDLRGQRFGRLTVMSREGGRPVKWNCVCDCGKTKLVRAFCLRRGYTRSCGCLNSELARARKNGLKHGRHNTPEYKAWQQAKERCYNQRGKDYARYGGRGIAMCDEWRDSFERFFSDMGQRPSAKHSLDRRDNDGSYSPGNCRWATRSQQQRNRRPSGIVRRGNRMLTFRGETLPLVAWAERLGLNWNTLAKRVDLGWTEEKILSTPQLPSGFQKRG